MFQRNRWLTARSVALPLATLAFAATAAGCGRLPAGITSPRSAAVAATNPAFPSVPALPSAASAVASAGGAASATDTSAAAETNAAGSPSGAASAPDAGTTDVTDLLRQIDSILGGVDGSLNDDSASVGGE